MVIKKALILVATVCLLLFANLLAAREQTPDKPARITVIKMDGMIAGGFLSYLEREVQRAERENSDAILILLNTPGGLVNTTIRINEIILNANIPVIVYVYPAGAIAASAGAFIVLASDIAAMAPATTIGSAQPVAITPEGAVDAGEKTRKFLSGQMSSLAEDKGRPVDVAREFIESNLALTAQEALDKKVIEYVADSIEDLLQQLDGVQITKKERTHTLSTADYKLHYRNLQNREAMQQWLSNPQMAMLFLMLGLMGLYVGFSNPGTFVPEVLGGIALVLGIYGLGMFETNFVGIALLIIGASLIVAEIFTAGFGILGIGGIIAFVLGALLLPVEPLMGSDWYGTFIRTVIGFGVGIGLILIFVVQRVISSIKTSPKDIIYHTSPETGTAIEEVSSMGMIKAKGELWQAKSADGSVIQAGKEVVVTGKEGLILIVEEKS